MTYDLSMTYAQDTITIARLRDENMAKLRRIEDMRHELLKLVLDLQSARVKTCSEDAVNRLILRLETIRGEPA